MSVYIKDYITSYLCENWNITDQKAEIEWIDARDLIGSDRIDLILKYKYVEYYVKKYEMTWIRQAYSAHIQAFSSGRFIEPGQEDKNTEVKFINAFHHLISNIKAGFEITKGAIPLGVNGAILDGAHRVAVCAYYNMKIPIIRIPNAKVVFDYRFFSRIALSEEYLDFMLSEYVKFYAQTDIYGVCIWPSVSVKKDVDEVKGILKSFGHIIYSKKIKADRHMMENLIYQVYDGFDWIGKPENHYAGSMGKAAQCSGKGQFLHYYILQGGSLEQIVRMKENLRLQIGKGKDSIHISDNSKETAELNKLFLNRNTLHLLRYGKPYKYVEWNREIIWFKERIVQQDYNSENFIIDSSGVMGLYGIRRPGDLDYLSIHNEVLTDHPFSSLNTDCLDFYNRPIDDIMFNPNHYLFYKGIKFISLELLMEFKKNRGEKRDLADYKVIADFLSYKKTAAGLAAVFVLEIKHEITRKKMQYKAILIDVLREKGLLETVIKIKHKLIKYE